ncbi:MAG: LacI family transcriptional regulator [Clostridiales bacterium]|jgi:DNA-binding LacI/PurR family transcriptional regulator|nr:LacI family transcriptional regulator [Clostridiales bacterium]
MSVTIRDVAKKAGVSPATVSRYFSGSDIVSTETARNIERAVNELGYQPKVRQKRDNGVIIVFVPDLKLGFYAEVLKELIDQLPKYNYRMMIVPTIEGSEHYKMFFKELDVAGVIYLDESMDRDIINYISSKNVKSVICAGASIDFRSDMIHINDMAAAYEGTKYLISLGHEKIIFLSDYLRNIDSSFQRFTGCKRALEEIGSQLDEKEMLACGPLTFDTGYRLTNQFLEKRTEFTAIFAFSDEVAMGAISALHDFGVKVPEEVSVLGFDDIAIASRIRPGLTTIHQPIKEMVAKTLEVFQNMDTVGSSSRLEITLPYKIISRGTCAENRRINIYGKK